MSRSYRDAQSRARIQKFEVDEDIDWRYLLWRVKQNVEPTEETSTSQKAQPVT
jgi:hypothetical protein